jgi:hypothetical protein
MKCRSGFVSNSSSSSFIVGFPKIPESIEETETIMFGKSGEISLYDDSITTHEIASTVFNEITTGVAAKVTKKKSTNVLQEGYFPGRPEYDYNDDSKESDKIRKGYKNETGLDVYDENADPKVTELYRKATQKEWKLEDEKMKIAAKAFIEGFWPQVKGKKVFRFEYSDNDGLKSSIMEHGEIFSKLPHVRINKH